MPDYLDSQVTTVTRLLQRGGRLPYRYVKNSGMGQRVFCADANTVSTKAGSGFLVLRDQVLRFLIHEGWSKPELAENIRSWVHKCSRQINDPAPFCFGYLLALLVLVKFIIS